MTLIQLLSFFCPGCRRRVGWQEGCSDAFPELCDECALPAAQMLEQGAPEAEPTGGAQRLGKITSSVSVPSTGKDRTDGK